MCRFMSLVLLVVLSAPGLAGAQGQVSTRTKRVAVLDFDYSTVRTNAAALFGTDIDVGRGISDMLVTSLVNKGTYSVVERAMLDQILAEQDFSNSDRADSRSAAQIGQVLSVDAIIVGSVTQFGNDTRSTGLGGVGRAVGRFGFGGFDQEESKAIVAIDARIIDVDTAEILAVAQGTGESSRRSTSILGGGGSWRRFGAGRVDFGSSDFQETILGEAVRLATEDLSGELVSQTDRIEPRQVVVEGLVAAVDGNLIIVNVGSDEELSNVVDRPLT